MEIFVGKTAGFCYGVERAVNGAKEEIRKNKEQIYCLGEIVHNKQVIQSLEKAGIKFIEQIEESKGKTIIRAHGISKKIEEKAKKIGIKLLDYTCPNVLKIHEMAEEYSKNGYYIFLLGNANHPENIGTISCCGKKYDVIENENEVYRALKNFEKSKIKKLLIISQTTYSLEKFYIIEEIIKNELPKNIQIEIKNTICKATELRQKETQELSKKVDYMIIIGGKNSSNTKKLYEIAKQNCDNTICVETSEEINLEELEENFKIGIMAGASTPKESIEEVVDKLCHWGRDFLAHDKKLSTETS